MLGSLVLKGLPAVQEAQRRRTFENNTALYETSDAARTRLARVLPMSVTVSLLCVCDSSPSSFSDPESCRGILVLLRLPARRMEDREPPFFMRKLRAPLIWSSREPPMRIFRLGAGGEGSGARLSKLFSTIS